MSYKGREALFLFDKRQMIFVTFMCGMTAYVEDSKYLEKGTSYPVSCKYSSKTRGVLPYSCIMRCGSLSHFTVPKSSQ